MKGEGGNVVLSWEVVETAPSELYPKAGGSKKNLYNFKILGEPIEELLSKKRVLAETGEKPLAIEGSKLKISSVLVETSIPEIEEDKIQKKNLEIKRKLDEEEKIFQERKEELREKYRDKYIAISRGEVIDSSENILGLAKQVKDHPSPVYIGYIGKEREERSADFVSAL